MRNFRSLRRLGILTLVVGASVGAPRASGAHEVRPGYLALTEVAAGRFEVLFKVPMRGTARLRMAAVLPANCRQLAPTASYPARGAVLERWTVECDGTIVGREVRIAGLEGTLTDVLVRIERLDGNSYSIRLRPRSPYFVIPEAPSTWDVARTYLTLGVEHILGGVDHLLFVLALLLIVGGRWGTLLKTITAFTVAHSLTLAAATLGWVSVPGAPVEAVIALSIVFLAAELAHAQMGRPGLTQQFPWIVAFSFGLLHGLGFAGALAEVGLPQNQIPLALFQFNVGVELGQLSFVGAVLGTAALWQRTRIQVPDWAWRVPAYGIGAVAAFWMIQRTVAFWP